MGHIAGLDALDPVNPGAWASVPMEQLFALPRAEVEELQLACLAKRFDALRPRVVALNNLASAQGVEQIDCFGDVVPVLFDHRVYKSYPLNLVEQRRFDRLTGWLQRLTTRDLSSVPLDGVDSVDTWLDRLDDHGMIVTHTTGTSGQLSFLPRSQAEWPAWSTAMLELMRTTFGVDVRVEEIPCITTGYRTGHHNGVKLERLLASLQAGGEGNRHPLYDFALSSDLIALAARLQEADDRGELDRLDFSPRLLEERAKLIERSRNRDQDLQRWFFMLADQYRGRRVRIQGLSADMVRLVRKGTDLGLDCRLAEGSIVASGGGMKGLKDPPADWESYVMSFFGVDRIHTQFGMSEIMGLAPKCDRGFFHFPPYVLPIVLDGDFKALPRDGVQTGRLALFDFLAETCWGGLISGDRVTIYWDDDCGCGWGGPRLDQNIARFSDLEGTQDDKLTCAGTAEAYNSFMDYIAEI